MSNAAGTGQQRRPWISAVASLRDIQLSKNQYADTPGHTPVCDTVIVSLQTSLWTKERRVPSVRWQHGVLQRKGMQLGARKNSLIRLQRVEAARDVARCNLAAPRKTAPTYSDPTATIVRNSIDAKSDCYFSGNQASSRFGYYGCYFCFHLRPSSGVEDRLALMDC
jgi:hypothetical protein